MNIPEKVDVHGNTDGKDVIVNSLFEEFNLEEREIDCNEKIPQEETKFNNSNITDEDRDHTDIRDEEVDLDESSDNKIKRKNETRNQESKHAIYPCKAIEFYLNLNESDCTEWKQWVYNHITRSAPKRRYCEISGKRQFSHKYFYQYHRSMQEREDNSV